MRICTGALLAALLWSYYMYILLFREKSWEGIINRKPTKSEYTSALQNKDLFLWVQYRYKAYCFHYVVRPKSWEPYFNNDWYKVPV